MQRDVVTIVCADRPGLIAEVTSIIAAHEANILTADQHTEDAVFVARFSFTGGSDALTTALVDWSRAAGAAVVVRDLGRVLRTAVCVSTELHCVEDLCARASGSDMPIEVAAIISDRLAASDVAHRWNIPFLHLPVGEVRETQEKALYDVLEQLAPDLVVLARYMRILPDYVTSRWDGRMINIHHSTLPAFVGGRPYERAFARGVKLIGATAHYVTADLDEGPIITQHSVDVGHRDSVEDMKRLGADVERTALAHAVRLHAQMRTTVVGDRCVVFE